MIPEALGWRKGYKLSSEVASPGTIGQAYGVDGRARAHAGDMVEGSHCQCSRQEVIPGAWT